MGLVPAKCTQCGARIQIDDTKEAGICPNCGTAFITEKVIKNYINNTYSTTNVENQTNIYYGENIFEKEKKECKLLLMLLNKMDLQYLKEHALKVLSINPDNSMAQMIYDCDFSLVKYNEYFFLDFNEQPLHDYLKKEIGNIDIETSKTFIKALILKASNDNNVAELVELILKNMSTINVDNDSLYEAYENMSKLIGDVSEINDYLYASKLGKVAGFLSMFDNSYEANDSFNDAREKKEIALSMLKSRKAIANSFSKIIKASSLEESKKSKILNNLSSLINVSNPSPTTSSLISSNTPTYSNSLQPEKGGSKAGGIALIVVGILLLIGGLMLMFDGSIGSGIFMLVFSGIIFLASTAIIGSK